MGKDNVVDMFIKINVIYDLFYDTVGRFIKNEEERQDRFDEWLDSNQNSLRSIVA